MSEQKLDDKPRIEKEAELESDNYLLNFLDSLYAGIIAFSFTIIYSTLVTENELTQIDMVKHLILFIMAFAFIVADWTGSRALTQDYRYLAKNYFARARLLIDILIGCLYFVLVILASLLSNWYLLIFAVVFILGASWSCLIRFEYKGSKFVTKIKEDPRLKAITVTHLILTAVFFFAWFISIASLKDRWTNTDVFWGVILVFWPIFIAFKIFCWIKLSK